MEEWTADIDAVMVASGRYVPVLVLVPPSDIGPPIRVELDGDYGTAEEARFAALDELATMPYATDSNRMR